MAIDPTSKVFTWTPMIRGSDHKYPVYLSDFLREHTNVSIGDFVWELDMAELWQYYMVHETEQPTGDVVQEGDPVFNEEDGLWYQTWTSRDFTAEEIAQNLSNAKDQYRQLAYQQYSTDLSTGIPVDGDTFTVEPRETHNLLLIREFALAHPESTVLIRRSDFTVMELPASDALEKISHILAASGKINQNLLTYIKSVYDTTVITDIPEVPATFVGE